MENDDDPPQLSAETFAALQEFYREQDQKQHLQTILSDNTPDENWQLSQFWYNDSTVNTLCKIAKKSVQSGDKIALISCPTLYKTFKDELNNCSVHLYEYDKRFSYCGDDFIYYDYNNPLKIPNEYKGYYDLVIADPPFLSEECLMKTVSTMKYIGKEKYILCTGAIMEDLANKLLKLTKTSFEPQHKNNLGNKFHCYSNYNIDDFL
ncbi:EEF1A lysine methyltransferase 1 [Onthophagus taurus]|uniref:EEF1A lysine methyltransferase 1 n=1 Tax=Onthophagus taurus TaxID=166361 RepID=UPI0039BE6DFE